jgi:hypothetical protein
VDKRRIWKKTIAVTVKLEKENISPRRRKTKRRKVLMHEWKYLDNAQKISFFFLSFFFSFCRRRREEAEGSVTCVC